MTGRYLPWVDAACGLVLLVLLVLDAFFPGWNLFLNDLTKAFILLFGLMSAICGMLLAGRQRSALRTRRRQRGSARSYRR